MKGAFLLLFLLMIAGVQAQIAPEFYLVHFTDKANSPFSVDRPYEFLGPRALEKRQRFQIPVTEADLPVNPQYTGAVLSEPGCRLHHRLKWQNAITIEITDTLRRDEILDFVRAFPFVFSVRIASGKGDGMQYRKMETELSAGRDFIPDTNLEDRYSDFYGPSFRQVGMINAHVLHELGLTGEGVVIALFDSGWDKTDVLPVFKHLWDRNAILGTKDFAFPYNDNVFTLSSHGTSVLSIIAGYVPDSLIGTAPDASYYLFRTENVLYEYLIEEYNWAAAAEYADSIGVDIINSSLGYSLFDDPLQNHAHTDLNGDITPSAIAADMAAQRGILVVNSAGNSGNQPWFFITSPSDADSVLCVGAVDANGHRAFFSGFGPGYDNLVKPDVMTMGQATVYAAVDGTIRTGNGTSFSSPVMAGGAALLFQACGGEKSNMEIIEAIRRSAHRYTVPSDSMGYGIPDLWKALRLIRPEAAENLDKELILVYPNPATNTLRVQSKWLLGMESIRYEIYDVNGRLMISGKSMLPSASEIAVVSIMWAEGELSPGRYTLRLLSSEKEERTTGFLVVRPG